MGEDLVGTGLDWHTLLAAGALYALGKRLSVSSTFFFAHRPNVVVPAMDSMDFAMLSAVEKKILAGAACPSGNGMAFFCQR